MVNINEIQEGNFFLFNYGNDVKEVCKVVSVNELANTLQVKILPNGSEFTASSNNLEGIAFEKVFLDFLGFIEDPSYRVFALPDTGAYVRFYPIGNDLIVKKEDCDWVLVLQNTTGYYGCEFKPIPYLHIFQNYVEKLWGLDTSVLSAFFCKVKNF